MRYIKGEGVARDVALGKSWVEKAAAQGYEPAKAQLAKLASGAGTDVAASTASTASTGQTNAPANRV